MALLALFAAFCLISGPLLVGLKVSVMATPDLLYVDAGNVLGPWNGTAAYPYQNITSALENAVGGDTIFVRNGVYYEHIVVNDTISLVGENNELTVIDSSSSGNVISIIGTVNAGVTGFNLRNSGGPVSSAILLQGSNGTVVSHNVIHDNINGITLSFSGGNVIINNVISSNFYGGINLFSSNGNVISDNTISDNSNSGIYLDSSSGNVVSENSLSLSGFYGFYLSSSANNVLSGNSVFSNGVAGISLTAHSDNNTIYHNNFNNTVQVSGSDSISTWSFGQEGNFWSNYNGQDSNRDGIGDTPYPIIANNEDYYPLMFKCITFDVIYKGESYNLAFISNSTLAEPTLEIGAETGNKILRFNATGEEGTFGFCRITIPTSFMPTPYVVLIDTEEANQTVPPIPDETYAHLYFAYPHQNQTISIISSVALHLYDELFNNFLNLNRTYSDLLNSYNALMGNYTQLLEASAALNASYQQLLALNATYSDLLNNYVGLNSSYYTLLNLYHDLSLDFSQLEDRVLNSEQVQNTRNLTYIVAGLTAIYIVTTVYLSKRAHTRTRSKAKEFEEEK